MSISNGAGMADRNVSGDNADHTNRGRPFAHSRYDAVLNRLEEIRER